jgi:hypothetical protein
MKFALQREISVEHASDNRVFVCEIIDPRYSWNIPIFCSTIIEVTKDWHEDDEFPMVNNYFSIQKRPKAIYKGPNGYYYKKDGLVYLTDGEVQEMFDYIERAKKHLSKE